MYAYSLQQDIQIPLFLHFEYHLIVRVVGLFSSLLFHRTPLHSAEHSGLLCCRRDDGATLPSAEKEKDLHISCGWTAKTATQ